MTDVLDMAGSAIWRASWQATILAVAVVVVIWLLGDRASGRWRYLLWSVVVARFLFVVTPASPWSPFNLLRAADSQNIAATAEPARIVAKLPTPAVAGNIQAPVPLTADADTPPTITAEAPSDALADSVSVTRGSVREIANPIGRAVPASAFSFSSRLALKPTTVLTAAWLIGCVIFSAQLLWSFMLLRRRVATCRLVTDPSVLRTLDAARQQLGLRATPPLYVTADSISPCVVGAWRPRLLVPESILTDAEAEPLRYVFVHELSHVARGDLWMNWLLLAARTLHWFNPAAWWTVRQMQIHRESACDEMTVGRLADFERRSYAEMILNMAARTAPSPLAPGAVGLFFARSRLAVRIERIGRVPSAVPLRPAAAWILVVLLALGGLTDARSTLSADEPDDAKSQVSADQPTAAAEKPTANYAIRGKALDEDRNTPLPGVQLTLYAARGLVAAPEKIAETVTNEKGEFAFEDLTPPRLEGHFDKLVYVVVARAEGRPSFSWNDYPYSQHRETSFLLAREAATLTGRVVNERGVPVAGATVMHSGIVGRPVPGVGEAVTNKVGRFKIENLVPSRVFGGNHETGFHILHPEYPMTYVTTKVPGEVEFKIAAGCTLKGSVIDAVTGKPAAGAKIVAEYNNRDGQTSSAVTDEAGQYRLIVREGNYNVLAEFPDRVAVAVTGRECDAGATIDLPPFTLTRGGFIAGRVLNPKTGQPETITQGDLRIALGLFGPARPRQKSIVSQTPLTEVDGEGRFVLRAAPGDNFPYFVNQHGDRMAWDTTKKPAVVVEEGKTTECDLFIEVKLTDEEKMKAAREIAGRLPDEPEARVASIIAEFRKLNHTVDETDVWCLLMRELVEIGPAALAQLCAELDATDEQRMLRRLGFALRAIGDPRAVPALIRAIPKTLQPGMSDYGLLVGDAELTAFMQKHDLDKGAGGTYFDLGRPVREVFGALHKLTGQNFGDDTIYSVHLNGNPQSEAQQRKLYRHQAERWQLWWNANWRKFTDDEKYAKVNLPAEKEPAQAGMVTLGPNAKAGEGVQGATLSPPGERGTHFEDIDTGLEPKWPKHIPQEEAAAEQGELALWAAQNGVDLMCVTFTPRNGEPMYALRSFNMRVWEISLRDAQDTDRWIHTGKPPVGQPAGELLLHYDNESQQYKPEQNAAFLYVTREGGMGIIEVTDRITRAEDITGMLGAPPGVGFFKGVKFNNKPIVP